MTFIDDENFLITEKTGKIFKLNINTGYKTEIIHELNIHTENRQGGLLDVHFYNDYIYEYESVGFAFFAELGREIAKVLDSN